MNFKFLKLNHFNSLLKMYEQVNTVYLDNNSESTAILIESTFLQLYSQLEEALYFECEQHFIKKNASIIRFETALQEQGYNTNNEFWDRLLELAKIRNCLIHGNGRIDNDKYGEDTRNTINSLNADAKNQLVEIIENAQNTSSKIKIKPELLTYFVNTIKEFCSFQ